MEEVLSFGSRMGSVVVFWPYVLAFVFWLRGEARAQSWGAGDYDDSGFFGSLWVMMLLMFVLQVIWLSRLSVDSYSEIGVGTIWDRSVFAIMLLISELYKLWVPAGATPETMLYLLGLCMLGFGIMAFIPGMVFVKLTHIFFATLSFFAVLEAIGWQ